MSSEVRRPAVESYNMQGPGACKDMRTKRRKEGQEEGKECSTVSPKIQILKISNLYSTSGGGDISLHGGCELCSSKLLFLRLSALDNRHCKQLLVDVGVAVENVIDLHTTYRQVRVIRCIIMWPI